MVERKMVLEINPEKLEISFADWVEKIPESEIRRLLRYSPKYYFGGGKPGILPVQTFHKIIEEIVNDEKELLDKNSVRALDNYNYGKTEGNDGLREVLAQRLNRKDKVNCTKDDLIITTGSQQILYALNDVLIRPGDVILVPRPTYLGFLRPAEKLGAKIVTLPTDEDGMLTEYIDVAIELCKKEFGKTPKVLYVLPYSDNPKGTTLSNKRKQEIINTVFPHNDILIIEDAAYKEIQFDDKEYRPLKEHDTENQKIAYLSSTTKEAASFRLGYHVLPSQIRDAVIKVKGYYDLCTSEFTQRIASKYYEKHIDEQIPIIRQGYKLRRDAMVKAVDEFMPEGTFTRPTGGFFVWYETLNKEFDSKIFIEEALANGISFVPGYSFFPSTGYNLTEENTLIPAETYTHSMRLGYSLPSPELITEGIEKLGDLLYESQKQNTKKVKWHGTLEDHSIFWF
ncbi:MAG: PLP-dependent aminotransferase family protein [Candidatus Heimdallarchaeota archaeon]|nr:PLP-dependent aminotransferase family protein [Candidatus Heimdallarchaeota archaeon]MCK4876979.1 PLP-dependent aminotransferase family protein [Candidatus Heimdallarchaeota archaeon]